MASRDLTATFLERRTAANLRRRSTEQSGRGPKKLTVGGTDDLLLEEGNIQMSSFHGHDSLASSSVLPPQWVDDVDGVNDALADIQRLMDVLQSLHASRVGSVFGRDLDDMEGKIEKLTRDITDRFRHAEKLLQRVGGATRRAGGEEATIGANIQRSLAKQLQELSVTFRQSQRKYLVEVQAQKSGGLVEDSKFGIDLSSGGGGGGGEDSFFTTQQVQVVDELSEAVQSRDKEIAKIAQSIEELGAIFKELAVLVIDQGTILDRIDYNMEAVVEHTKTGIQQLEKAEKHQKSARPMKCIFCLLSVICVLLILLVLKHRRHRGWFR